ncbi:nitrate- and nitrite sensing domain-containing protein [Streptomyces sp. MUM 136J]|uniref:sensor histidine kinase n=1 Tax=Streptomyces sp. MUM 136J TaxID=2791992 RepID=UPI001F04202D|nr:nitrate- and nitrite sensing domain-containing protein [Streptomyces sp. MUM 136J]MCH0569229.1 nitrate- and nitrite sensing domain-containing protein [Streptomyces sp. MUM 136J]
MRWPSGRLTTVRARIVALALAPAVALMILWAFAMVSVTGELRSLVRLQGVYEDFGTPVDTAIGQIQIERRLSAAYLGEDPGTASPAALLAQQRHTDRAVDAMRQAIDGGDRGRLTGRQRQVLDAMTAAAGRLDGLRARVLARTVTWDGAVDDYDDLVEPGFDVQSALTALQAGQLAREAQVVTELVRVREFVSREDALVAGAQAAGGLTGRQYDALTATVEDRRVFERTYVPDLPADSRGLFEDFQRDDLHRSLVRSEDALLRAGARGAGDAVTAGTWRSTTDRAVQRYMELCTRAAENSAARGRAFAYRELAKAVVVGVVGLTAVGLSLWLAVRGARRVSRRLDALRDAADLLASRQLPDVMRRLSAGEEVDAVAEAPPLAGTGVGADEIGQVGRSFNAARLAAVEAAVRQAALRRGLSAVLLNIARRNQALVHRQLKLVDTLERRAEDPDMLRELFRIDHLTTRMRRHAESLIILSGDVPGRRWRRPVPVAEVVAAAVSEIEDYARVEVPPMDPVGVAADAVADVVHLIAELLENATAFSPPRTRVTLRGGRVGAGFVLEIDDRGLGLDTDQLDEATRTLTRPDDFDPTRHDRLGLYVVARLAARHAIEVTLRRSPYGGTTAVVLLPTSVLAETDPGEPGEPGMPGRLGPGEPAAPGSGAREDTSWAKAAPATPAQEAPAHEGPPRPSPVPADPRPVPLPSGSTDDPSAGPHPRDTVLPLRRRTAPATRGTAPDGARAATEPRRTDPADPADAVSPPRAGSGSGSVRAAEAAGDGRGARATATSDQPDAAGATGAGERDRRTAPGERDRRTGPGSTQGDDAAGSRRQDPVAGLGQGAGAGVSVLPTRIGQASLVAGLRTDPPAADPGPGRERSAEDMRAILGAFQRGLGRDRGDAPGGAATGGPADTERETDSDHAP